MDVLLSWSGDLAKTVANAFYDWLDKTSSGSNIKIYFSPKSNDPGTLWRKNLRGALAQSSVGVFFLTREGVRSPWVLFEGGAVGKWGSSRVFTILIDFRPGDLAALAPPFEEYQAVNFEKDGLWRVVTAIAKNAGLASGLLSRMRDSFDTWWPSLKQRIDRTIDTGLTGAGDWGLVSEASVVSHIGGSPFEAKHLFRIATSRLDFVAQNHHFVTVEKNPEHLELLRNFLNRPEREVKFLAMDPRKQSAVRAWTELMGTKDFPGDLRKAVANLRKWKNTAIKEKWKGKLEIRLSGLIPTSQTFVDGESNHGRLVVIPMGKKPTNTDRSAFVLSKAQNPEAFGVYWTTYEEHFKRAKKL